MASFLAAMPAGQLVCWDEFSSSISPWYSFCPAPAAVSCLTADYKLSGTGTVLPCSVSIPPYTRSLVTLVKLWCKQPVKMKKPTKG